MKNQPEATFFYKMLNTETQKLFTNFLSGLY